MIIGYFHKGSGLGNQIHRYVATRVLALDKGCDFGMLGKKEFKGSSFMNIDFGKETHIEIKNFDITGRATAQLYPETQWGNFIEFSIKDEFGNVLRSYDPEINFVEDNTIIDGEFQDIRYFGHRLEEIDEWLKVEPLDVPDDVCVIGFRGGEFYMFPELGLPTEYFEEGVKIMRDINPRMKFEIHTDDVQLAEKMLGHLPVIRCVHDVGINWRSMRYAKYAIIANSSFYILPRLLRSTGGFTIAPRYWARRNTGIWSTSQNYYYRFKYI